MTTMLNKEMEKKERIFAIDVDGVLRDNLPLMVKLYNKEFDDNKTVDDITDYMTEISFPRIEPETGKTASYWFFQEHSKELFLDAKPFPYVKEDIEKLREYGKVIIVSYQKTFINKKQTLEWLEKNGIDVDGVCFLKDKTLLSGADWFIDDNTWNFQGMRAKHGIVISAPYNKNEDVFDILEKSECETIERFDTFHNFVENFNDYDHKD